MTTDTQGPEGRRTGVLPITVVLLLVGLIVGALAFMPGEDPDTAADPGASTEVAGADDPLASGDDTNRPAGDGVDESSADADGPRTDVEEGDGIETPLEELPVQGPTGPMSRAVARDTLANAFEGEEEVLSGDGAAPESRRSSTEAYAEALALRLTEFEDQGWTQVGAPTIKSLEIVEEQLDTTPPRVVVLACVDSSDVDILDDEGNSLRNEGTPSRSANLYTLVREERVWSIADVTFPEDPDC